MRTEQLDTTGMQHQGSTLQDYLRVVRRRKWVVVAAVVLVTASTLIFSLNQESLYRASSQVLLSDQNLANALTGTQQSSGVSLQADRVAQTQADLARVSDVARRTLEAAAVTDRTPSWLLRHSSVTAKANADILAFSVTDHDPKLAAKLATAYATQYVQYRQRIDTGALQRARAEVRARIAALPPHSASLLRNLLEKDQQLATMEALQTANASVVENALGATQVQPRPLRNAVLGVMLGLVLGLVAAFIWEALDSRVRSAEEIAGHLGLPLLARLPAPPKRLRKESQLVLFAEPRGTGAEAFRMLRTNLELVRLSHDVKSIAVTSAVEQEGKSTSIANLAVTLARGGQNVALVDLDLRRPFLDQFFDVRGRPGLTDVALGHAQLDEALTPVAIRDLSQNGHAHTGSLSVLNTGPLPPDPGDFVGNPTLAAILDVLRDRYDTVLIDTPPTLKAGDAMTLSSRVDALLVVVRMNVARRSMLNEMRRLLATSPARKLGFVVTGAESEEGYGYGGYDSYSGAVQVPAGIAERVPE